MTNKDELILARGVMDFREMVFRASQRSDLCNASVLSDFEESKLLVAKLEIEVKDDN